MIRNIFKIKLNQKGSPRFAGEAGLIQWIALLILAIALPAVLYLSQKTQIFKPRATEGIFQVSAPGQITVPSSGTATPTITATASTATSITEDLADIELYSVELDNYGSPNTSTIAEVTTITNKSCSSRYCTIGAIDTYTQDDVNREWKYFIKVYSNPQTVNPTQPPAPTTPPVNPTQPPAPTTPPGSSCPGTSECYEQNNCNQATANSGCGGEYGPGYYCDPNSSGTEGDGCTAPPDVEGVSTSSNVLQAAVQLYCSGLPQGSEPPCSGGNNGISQIVTVVGSGGPTGSGTPTPTPQGGTGGTPPTATVVVASGQGGSGNNSTAMPYQTITFQARAQSSSQLSKVRINVADDQRTVGTTLGETSNCSSQTCEVTASLKWSDLSRQPSDADPRILYYVYVEAETVDGGSCSGRGDRLAGTNDCAPDSGFITNPTAHLTYYLVALQPPATWIVQLRDGIGADCVQIAPSRQCNAENLSRWTTFGANTCDRGSFMCQKKDECQYPCEESLYFRHMNRPMFCRDGPGCSVPLPNRYRGLEASCYGSEIECVNNCFASEFGLGTCGTVPIVPHPGGSGYGPSGYGGGQGSCVPGQPGCNVVAADTCPEGLLATTHQYGPLGEQAPLACSTLFQPGSATGGTVYKNLHAWWRVGLSAGPSTYGGSSNTCANALSWKVEKSGAGGTQSKCIPRSESLTLNGYFEQMAGNTTGSYTVTVTAYANSGCSGAPLGKPATFSGQAGAACTVPTYFTTPGQIYRCETGNRCVAHPIEQKLGGYNLVEGCQANCTRPTDVVISSPTPTPTPTGRVLPAEFPSSVKVVNVPNSTDCTFDKVNRDGVLKTIRDGTARKNPPPADQSVLYVDSWNVTIGSDLPATGNRYVCAQFYSDDAGTIAFRNAGGIVSQVINFTGGATPTPTPSSSPTPSPTPSPGAGQIRITGVSPLPSCISGGKMTDAEKTAALIIWENADFAIGTSYKIQISSDQGVFEKPVEGFGSRQSTDLTGFVSTANVSPRPTFEIAVGKTYSIKIVDNRGQVISGSTPHQIGPIAACTASPTPSPSSSPGRVACTALTIDNNQSVSIAAAGGSKNIDVEFTPADSVVRFSVSSNPSSAPGMTPREVRFGTGPQDRNWTVDIPANTTTTENIYTISSSIISGGATFSCPRPVTVRVAPTTSDTACPANIQSTQVKFKLADDTGEWLGSRTITHGEGVRVAGFHNNDTPASPPGDITLSVSGPSGFSRNLANGSVFNPPAELTAGGIYTFTATTTGKVGANCIGTGAVTVQPRPSPSPTGLACTVKTEFPDVNGDGKIDLLDLNIWRDEKFGRAGTTSADVDCRNSVNDTDRTYIFDHFGETR